MTTDDAPLSVVRRDIEDAASDFGHHADTIRGMLLRVRVGSSANFRLRGDVERVERDLKKLVSDLKKLETRLAIERLGRKIHEVD